MLIILKKNHTATHLAKVSKHVEDLGCKPQVIRGTYRTTINVLGNDTKIDPEEFKKFAGVEEVIAVLKQYQLVGRDFKDKDSHIKVGNVSIGPGNFAVIAGPCAVETEEQTLSIARVVKKAGANLLRGGAYKPRTSPYAFQGLGLEGLKILQLAKKETGLPIVSEALDMKSLEFVYEYADVIQIGTRNMQNFSLLKAVGKLDKPVLFKRGMSASIDEWLMAAEYIASEGNDRIIFCERGIRSFDDKHTRNLLDLSAIPVIKSLSHLPIIVDPSHATGRKDAVVPMTLASMAAGAHAVMIDVHGNAEEALCDGAQALTYDDFSGLMKQIKSMAKALNIGMV